MDAHTKHDRNIHLVWIPKYRKKILKRLAAVRASEVIRQIAMLHDMKILSGKVSRYYIGKGIPMAQVGFALTLLFAGGAVEKFVCGILAEWVGVIPMVVGTEVLTSAGILPLIWSSSLLTWFTLPLVGVFLNGTSSVLYATVAEIISPRARSRGYGLYYAITLGSGAIAPTVYGFFTDSFGLSLTLIAIALIVLLTLPLTRYLAAPKTLAY